MRFEFSGYTTPDTLELLPFVMINRITHNDDWAVCIMIGWITLVFSLQISSK